MGYHYPTNEDSDFDGLPDAWEYYWFGSYAYSGTNVDANGSTFLDDYNAQKRGQAIVWFVSGFTNIGKSGGMVMMPRQLRASVSPHY